MRSRGRDLSHLGANGFDRMLGILVGALGTHADPVNTCVEPIVANNNYALAA